MIVGLYVLSPLLRMIAADRSASRYFLWVWFLGVPVWHFVRLFPVGQVLSPLLSTLIPPMGFIGYFLLGHHLHVHHVDKGSDRWVWLGGCLCILLTWGMTYGCSLRAGRVVRDYIQYLLVLCLIPSAACFLFAKDRLSGRGAPGWARAAIARTSRYSFGIYLVHVLILDTLQRAGVHSLRPPALLEIPLLTLLVFALGFAVVSVLDRIKVVNRYLI